MTEAAFHKVHHLKVQTKDYLDTSLFLLPKDVASNWLSTIQTFNDPEGRGICKLCGKGR